MVLKTDPRSRARTINFLVAFFVVLPLAFTYFYLSNISLIDLIFTESRLPEARSSNGFLTLVHYTFVLVAFLNFFMLTAIGIGVGFILFILAQDLYKSYK
mmetsp:Transcript_37464/g.45634  ORF Transcript_37464/g.45634 Transcript_37464/m.45634 type:complete len:100 (+) Transcript_37464:268-567(+)